MLSTMRLNRPKFLQTFLNGRGTMTEIDQRKSYTEGQLRALRDRLGDAELRIKGKACVYATGSFGRFEASEHSDLDLFIVGLGKDDDAANSQHKSQLSRLDEICVKADLIQSTREIKIPDFDGDGKYLTHYAISELTDALGTPEDDSNNTFTARLLLLLESQPVIGHSIYRELLSSAIEPYWRDFPSHKHDFVPAFFANDILRLWRTFCVNYEARTRRSPDHEKISGKLKNYKLKHSRLLTCYSAILYLLVLFQKNGTVTPDDALEMVSSTPLQRIVWLSEQDYFPAGNQAAQRVVDQYNLFLERTSEPKGNLLLKFADSSMSSKLMMEANYFGELMYELLQSVGNGTRFHRIIAV